MARLIAPTKPGGGRTAALLSSEADRSQLSAPIEIPVDIVDPAGRPLINNAASPLAPARDTPSGIASPAPPGGARRIAKRTRGELDSSSAPCVRDSTAACVRPKI